jgi:hypothetical protein
MDMKHHPWPSWRDRTKRPAKKLHLPVDSRAALRDGRRRLQPLWSARFMIAALYRPDTSHGQDSAVLGFAYYWFTGREGAVAEN